MKMIIKLVRRLRLPVMWFWISGRGSRAAASASKIKNRIVIKKNRKENEFRILCDGLKPHSNGDIFSQDFAFVFRSWEITYIIHTIKMEIFKNRNKILLFIIKPFNWKLNILIY